MKQATGKYSLFFNVINVGCLLNFEIENNLECFKNNTWVVVTLLKRKSDCN